MKNTCAVTIPGHRDEQSSYRGELGGILTGISIANSLLTKEGITSGECTFCCDNKGALDASFGWKNPNPTWTCYDLVSAIRHQLHTSPIAWSHQHIHGHQDKDQHFDELSAVAQANVLVDKLAKEELRALRTPDEDNTSITDMWKLTCEGQHITGDIEQRLRYFMQETVSKQWWTQTLRIPSGSENQISWEVYYAYRKTTPLWLNTWSVKFGADILPTRKNMLRRGHSDTHKCPCCGANNEDAKHLYQCTDSEMDKAFEEGLDNISDYLQVTTSGDIKRAMIETLRTFRSEVREHNLPDTEEPTSLHLSAASRQHHIGITASLNGIWSIKWIEAQTQYLRQSQSRRSAKVWLTRLTNRLQIMLHTLWKVRNEAIHRREESVNNKERHLALDLQITDIYQTIPSLRLLPTCDAAFFKRGATKTKRYRLRRKELWVEEATRIRDAFFDSLDPQAESFLNYFSSATR